MKVTTNDDTYVSSYADPEFYTAKDIQQILKISKDSAYKFITHNPPFAVFKINNTYRISKSSFDKWANGTNE